MNAKGRSKAAPAPQAPPTRTAAAAAYAVDGRWLALGLPAAHPLVPVVRRRYRPRVYESTLYIVHEPGQPAEVGDLRWEVAWL